jgi:hypothetical protein
MSFFSQVIVPRLCDLLLAEYDQHQPYVAARSARPTRRPRTVRPQPSQAAAPSAAAPLALVEADGKTH